MSKKAKAVIVLPNEEQPEGVEVLLHCCCAPCSSAILEWMLQSGMRPTVFFSNSNIFPPEEYLHRRAEIENHLKRLDVPFVDDEYDHRDWLAHIKGLEHEPERGRRCEQCFRFRLRRAALYAQAHGFRLLTTTLASSRWKDLAQVNAAGEWACRQVEGVTFWPQNWRKGGLQDRRNFLLRFYGFYNQQYCGCEFSERGTTRPETCAPKPDALLIPFDNQ